MTDAEFEELKKSIDDRIALGKVSQEEIDEILEATRHEYKKINLTEDEIVKISRYASEQLDKTVERKLPIEKGGLVLSIINFLMAFLQLPVVLSAIEFSYSIEHNADLISASAQIFWILTIVLAAITFVFDFFVLFFALRHKPAQAARVVYGDFARVILLMICAVQIVGTGAPFMLLIIYAIWLCALSTYFHPTLRTERAFEKTLRQSDTHRQYEEGTLGLQSDPKKGYIKLDFFNLFWIFVIGSVVGLVAEIVFHMACIWPPGEFHDRAGLLYGPFSPIYGFGALLMTIALNRVRNWNTLLIFVFCTIIGGAFEYFVSWFMETSFGIVAWDYTGHFLSIDGRTCLLFASMFGVMGTVWIKWALPVVMKLVNKIPWKIRYSVTSICAVLMIINCFMTLCALDCWYDRMSGKEPVTPIEQFYAENYDNDWMANRFESMSIDPNKAVRSEE